MLVIGISGEQVMAEGEYTPACNCGQCVIRHFGEKSLLSYCQDDNGVAIHWYLKTYAVLYEYRPNHSVFVQQEEDTSAPNPVRIESVP